jgi:hypothetical protein
MDDPSSPDPSDTPTGTDSPKHPGVPTEITSNKPQPPQSPAAGPVHSPVSNRAGSSDAMRPDPTEEHERRARDMDDALVHQIFAASLDLSAALTNIDDHRAAEKVLHAINGLDQAIKDLRMTAFEPGATGIPERRHSGLTRRPDPGSRPPAC